MKISTIAVTLFVLAIGLSFVFGNKGGIEVEHVQETGTVIIEDTRTVYDGLKDFTKKKEIQKKVELVEKEAFLQYRKEVLEAKYESEIAELEQALDSVRGELSVS
jgi:ABC-type lipoprotein release transport system permease subunit